MSLHDGIFNVRDYGAKGNGIHDDTVAIQAAVNQPHQPRSPNRGTIYFPVGTYRITSPIIFAQNLNIACLGDPGATISGNFGDFLLRRVQEGRLESTHSIENLQLLNRHERGRGIALHGCVGRITNCYVSAWRGIESYNSQSILVDTCKFVGPKASRSSVGILAGSATSVTSLTISGYEHGIRHHNVGLNVCGGSFNANAVGIMIGIDENGNNFQSRGFNITGVSMESNQTGIHVSNGVGGAISGVSIGGGTQMDYGLRLGSCQNTVVQSVVVRGKQGFKRAGIAIEIPTRTTFIGVRSLSRTAWSLPATRRLELAFLQTNRP
ncbi:MAG TPA: glycosyl hydrolase family 28-related protein [Lacipirellulaceae bacterium]|nr:glycosyl hydrolase family 28-related protein [Lacipirellulaceae bacterium]